jgi:SulP family sulfate permease
MNNNQSQQSATSRPDLTALTPSLVGGLVSGFYIAIFMFAYASLIFTGELEPFLPRGIGALLFGAIAVGFVMALMSALSGLIAAPNDNPVAISAILAIAVAASMPSSASPEETFITVLIAIAPFILLGQFKLGNLVRFIPYPVIGGFLAGTGLIMASSWLPSASSTPVCSSAERR